MGVERRGELIFPEAPVSVSVLHGYTRCWQEPCPVTAAVWTAHQDSNTLELQAEFGLTLKVHYLAAYLV